MIWPPNRIHPRAADDSSLSRSSFAGGWRENKLKKEPITRLPGFMNKPLFKPRAVNII